jgi:hypothetical protein
MFPPYHPFVRAPKQSVGKRISRRQSCRVTSQQEMPATVTRINRPRTSLLFRPSFSGLILNSDRQCRLRFRGVQCRCRVAESRSPPSASNFVPPLLVPFPAKPPRCFNVKRMLGLRRTPRNYQRNQSGSEQEKFAASSVLPDPLYFATRG